MQNPGQKAISIEEILREQMLTQMIADRDAIIINAFQEINNLKNKIAGLENQINQNLQEAP